MLPLSGEMRLVLSTLLTVVAAAAMAADTSATGAIEIWQSGARVVVQQASATVVHSPLVVRAKPLPGGVFVAWVNPSVFPELKDGAIIPKMIGTGWSAEDGTEPKLIGHASSRIEGIYSLDAEDLGFTPADVAAIRAAGQRLGSSATQAYVFGYTSLPVGKDVTIAWPTDLPADSPATLAVFSEVESSQFIRWERIQLVTFTRRAP